MVENPLMMKSKMVDGAQIGNDKNHNNVAANCPILLKFGRLVHYGCWYQSRED